MSDVLGVYFVVKADGDKYVIDGGISGREDLKWLLLDYPNAIVDIYSTTHMLLYENKKLSDITGVPSIDIVARKQRAELIREGSIV